MTIGGRVVVVLALLALARVSCAAEPALRIETLAAQVVAAEDLSAVKRLQRTYGYYLDKGLWADLAEYFTDDAVASYPAGSFVGKESIRRHLYRNVGNVPVGQVGLGDNRLYNHMNLQPVVHLDPGGNTARGRWREIAYFGSLGGSATWAEGIYEMQYRKEAGVWKIARLDYYSGFSAPYATGWIAPAATPASGQGAVPAARAQPGLAHPADRAGSTECEGFLQACVAPFHYANPGTPEGGNAWTEVAVVPVKGAPRRVLADLARRATRLRDEQQLENLQRIYGYYLDRQQWDQVADLFTADGTIEFGQQGVYVGQRRVREFLGQLGPEGIPPGRFNDLLQLQTVVTVADNGLSARIRSRQFGMTGEFGQGGQWSEGLYENRFVKEEGVWKFSAVQFFPTFISDYDKGWAQDAQPAPGPLATLPPDRAPTQRYAIYPKAHVPPFHYRNPVTGRPSLYPVVGGPDARLARRFLMTDVNARPDRVGDIDAVLARAERDVARARDYHEIENLESAYGYYLDKNLWNPLADLFARDGSIELAHRGVYQGPRVRGFLLQVFGRGQEGPVAGRLGNHVQLQPVISVAEDGSHARIRLRMLQQMSMGGRASIGGAIYENEAIKEGGVWKFSKVNTYNTFSAEYGGGWARAAGRGMPGESADFPPDAPPTRRFAMFPVVYDIPYHYANPVSGRTAVPALPGIETQLAAYPVPAPPAPRIAAPPGMPAEIAAALRAIGPKIDGPATAALYAPLQPAAPWPGVSLQRDLAYGPHERHLLDVFTPTAPVLPGAGRPIVVFIHGGGFSRGAKSAPGSPFYDNIGRWAAQSDLVGITINYRLAPQFPFPAGVEDLARVVAWVRRNASRFGGDPSRLFLWGHSAGAAHVADYLVRAGNPAVTGSILTSGIYALGDTVSVWKDYYGDDVSRYRERESITGLARSPLPLLVVQAELDPPAFIADTEGLIRARTAAKQPLQTLRLAGHSHISETYAVGTADVSLSGAVLQFINATPPARRRAP
jgi:triacylglycerol lipase